jgi:hypothetical protein
MRNAFRVLLVLGALLFVNTPSVRADMATFSATSRVELRSPVPLPDGLTVEIVGTGTILGEALVTTHFGSGRATSLLPAIDFPLAFSVAIEFQTIAGQAGPEFGAEGISQVARSKQLKFTNSTANNITIKLTYTFGTDLATTASGDGHANAQFQFMFANPRGDILASRVFSVQSPGPNSSISFTNGKEEFFFAIPPNNFTFLTIRGSQTGLAAVPEPATMLLLGTGLTGVAIKTQKKLKTRKRVQGRQ